MYEYSHHGQTLDQHLSSLYSRGRLMWLVWRLLKSSIRTVKYGKSQDSHFMFVVCEAHTP